MQAGLVVSDAAAGRMEKNITEEMEIISLGYISFRKCKSDAHFDTAKG